MVAADLADDLLHLGGRHAVRGAGLDAQFFEREGMLGIPLLAQSLKNFLECHVFPPKISRSALVLCKGRDGPDQTRDFIHHLLRWEGRSHDGVAGRAIKALSCGQ